MEKYTYYTPTHLWIGEDIQNVGKVIKDYGYKQILFVYGGGSIKKRGLYQKIVSSLEENQITYFEAGGVEPNPKVTFVREVLAKNYAIDFILAVGGGSVIDTAKSISVSYLTKVDPWCYNSYVEKPTKALPIGVVLTISAAGSEMSNSCVISNPELSLKQGFNADIVRPLFAFMNPELTYSVSKYQTACGVVDIMMHTLERYISKEDSMLADEFAIGLLKTVKKYGTICYLNPENYEARKEIMLASSFSHNGLTSIGKKFILRAHQFEHVLSGFHDNIAHGAGLAVCWPAYAKYVYKERRAFPKFLRLAYDVFEVKKTDDPIHDAYQGILAMEDYFQFLGMPIRLEEFNVKKDELETFALSLSRNKTRVIDDIIPISYQEAKEIFQLMFAEE